MGKFISILSVMFVFILGVHPAGAHAKVKEETCVRIVHASPNAPAVDVVVDGEKVLQGVKFKDVSDKLMVTPGNHKVEIMGHAVTKDKKPLLSKDVTIEKGKCYTVVAANKAEKLELVIFEIPKHKGNGKAHVRVGHFSPDAPAVDIGLKNKEAAIKGLAFKNISNFQEFNAGTYDLEVRLSGTNKVALNLAGTALKGNTMYTVLAVGCAGGNPPLSVIVIEEACQ